jgi:CO/xanthine dehydrogenase FAD-binding subunit
VTVHRPTSIAAALDALAAAPDALVLAGGTDVMVAVNEGHRRPGDVVALAGVAELREVAVERTAGRDVLVIGAGVTHSMLCAPPVADRAPALATVARTVGSPQIRNAGTIGGNLGTASPAGDTLPVLLALDAAVELTGPGGSRTLPVREFVTGVKRTALAPGELITAVRVPVVRGPQDFLKVGVRNAMVIAVTSVALVVDLDRREVAVGLGAVGPGPLGAPEACRWLARRLHWDDDGVRLGDPDDAARFGRLVTEAARPIDDHRGRADYRRHAVGVLAERAVRRATAWTTA